MEARMEFCSVVREDEDMKSQPGSDVKTNDVVQTPVKLAKDIVMHFNPEEVVLEPCRGEGNFYRHLPSGSPWCEISEGKDFFNFSDRVNWIITNPPWSKVRGFLQHGMEIADHIVFLMTINYVWTNARLKLIAAHGFGIKEILWVPWPGLESNFPRSGFALGAIHIERNWKGDIRWENMVA